MNNEFEGTMPLKDNNKLDIKYLSNYLNNNIEDFGTIIDIRQFKGGQSNPTFKVITEKKDYVLRKKPNGKLLPSAHAIDREYKIIKALRQTDVPVAEVYCLCRDDSIIGTMFYVMEFIDGAVMWDGTLPKLNKNEQSKIYNELNRVISCLHNVDFNQIGLEDFGKPNDYILRQIKRWTKQYRASETEKIQEMENLIQWLPENIPEIQSTSLVHGDYRLDNVIFDHSKKKILAVLDWELSTLGDPVADFAYHCMYWRLSREQFRGIADVDFSLSGIPNELDYIKMYCKRTKRLNLNNWDFYIAYNMFRLSGILQGIMGRYYDGTASNDYAFQQGKKAKPMAEAGWRQVQKINKKN